MSFNPQTQPPTGQIQDHATRAARPPASTHHQPVDNLPAAKFLDEIKSEVRSARVRAARAVNTELSDLYWRIGRLILNRQEKQGWGAAVIAHLAADLRGPSSIAGRSLGRESRIASRIGGRTGGPSPDPGEGDRHHAVSSRV